MGIRQDILEYIYGESIAVRVHLRNRDQDALDLTGVVVSLIISERETDRKLVELKSPGDSLLIDGPTSIMDLLLPPARQRHLRPNVDYKYDLWTTGSERLHQAQGVFRLKSAPLPQ